MPGDEKKTMFVPPDIKESDIPPLLLGNNFSMKFHRQYGFFRTGEYYFILQDNFLKYDQELLYIVNFNRNKMALEKKLLFIESSGYEEDVVKLSKLDPYNGKIVHMVQSISENPNGQGEEIVFDVFHINLADHLSSLGDYIELAIDRESSHLKIKYVIEQFNKAMIDMFTHHRDKEKTVLMFSAFYREDLNNNLHEENWLYFPRACIDIVNMKGKKIWHVKRIMITLKEMAGFLDCQYAPSIHQTDEGILFYQETEDENGDQVLQFQEFDSNGEYKHAYSVPCCGVVSSFQPYGNYFYLYSMLKRDEGDKHIRLIKLEEGEIKVIEKIEALRCLKHYISGVPHGMIS